MAQTMTMFDTSKKVDLTKLATKAATKLKDNFSKTSQQQLLSLLEIGTNHVFNSTGNICEVVSKYGTRETYEIFAMTVQNIKVKLSKANLLSIVDLVKEMPINVTLRFNTLAQKELVKAKDETAQAFELRVSEAKKLLDNAVTYTKNDGTEVKGFVLFDSVSW